MAELDYAFLADYADVTGGKLTVVGGSWTHLFAATVPIPRLISVAGRVTALDGHEPIHAEVQLVPPDESFKIQISIDLVQGPDTLPYGTGAARKLGHLFAAQITVPITVYGLYQVLILLDGEQVRRLAFEVAEPPIPGE